MSPRSTHIKLLVEVLLALMVAFAITFFLVARHMQDYLETELVNRTETLAKTYSEPISLMLWQLDYDGVGVLLQGMVSQHDFAYVDVRDNSGKIITFRESKQVSKASSSSSFAIFLQRTGDKMGELTIKVSHDHLSVALNKLIKDGLLLGMSVLVVLALVISINIRLITRPMRELSRVINRLSQDELSLAVPYQSRNDEVGTISRAVEKFRQFALHRKELIRKQLENEEQLRYQAHYDSLTGLPNRFLTKDRLTQLITEAERDKRSVALSSLISMISRKSMTRWVMKPAINY